ncbi:MAG: rhomboid family intramembrane serine protease [Woeseiaceae bacterium]|nr:rhomboid family intramembrane serine protease [Woeseiaceae bacterium]
MNEDLRVVFESRNRRACADRALVLASVGIPHEIVEDGGTAVLVVPAAVSARAVDELLRYDEENPPALPVRRQPVVYQNALPGILGYVIVVCLFAGLSWRAMFSLDWLAAGRVDGADIRTGEWWRSVTALTLHSGVRHLAGNLVFGALFGLFAGRLLGPGIAWLTIVLAGAAGNLLNTLFLDPAHRSIGASTAVFAALGLVAGYVWRGRLMAQDRWPYRVGPIVGGFALLMYTGTGGPDTDIGAHLMGFLAGLGAGVLLTPLAERLPGRRAQNAAGTAALALVGVAWLLAFTA